MKNYLRNQMQILKAKKIFYSILVIFDSISELATIEVIVSPSFNSLESLTIFCEDFIFVIE